MSTVKFSALIVLVFAIVFVPSCKKEENEPRPIPIEQPEPLAVGDFHEGGVVFYLDETGLHGLVSTLSHLDVAYWGCDSMLVDGADGTAIGDGDQNTMDIFDACSTDSLVHAAYICSTYEVNEFNDWYLPSKDELQLIKDKENTLANLGIELIGWFWTSSEVDIERAWAINFMSFEGELEPAELGKGAQFKVIAIRAF